MDREAVISKSTKANPEYKFKFEYKMWCPVCVPEGLNPEPIRLSAPEIALDPPTIRVEGKGIDPWPNEFKNCKDVQITIYFPGTNSSLPNKSWIAEASGEKYLRAWTIILECSAPEVLISRDTESGSSTLHSESTIMLYFGILVDRLLTSIRWRTGQYWIRQPANLHQCLLKAERTEPSAKTSAWNIEGGEPYPDYRHSNVLDQVKWKQTESDLRTGEEPPLYEEFLLDARHANFAQDGRAVLYAAIAIEIFTKHFYGERGVDRDPLYSWVVKHDVDIKIPFTEYYGSLAKCLYGRSLKEDQPETFQLINRLFETRNKFMHEGRAYFRSKSGKQMHDARFFQREDMINAAYQAIDWLKHMKAQLATDPS